MRNRRNTIVAGFILTWVMLTGGLIANRAQAESMFYRPLTLAPAQGNTENEGGGSSSPVALNKKQDDSPESRTSVKLSQQVINPTTLLWQIQLEEFATSSRRAGTSTMSMWNRSGWRTAPTGRTSTTRTSGCALGFGCSCPNDA